MKNVGSQALRGLLETFLGTKKRLWRYDNTTITLERLNLMFIKQVHSISNQARMAKPFKYRKMCQVPTEPFFFGEERLSFLSFYNFGKYFFYEKCGKFTIHFYIVIPFPLLTPFL